MGGWEGLQCILWTGIRGSSEPTFHRTVSHSMHAVSHFDGSRHVCCTGKLRGHTDPPVQSEADAPAPPQCVQHRDPHVCVCVQTLVSVCALGRANLQACEPQHTKPLAVSLQLRHPPPPPPTPGHLTCSPDPEPRDTLTSCAPPDCDSPRNPIHLATDPPAARCPSCDSRPTRSRRTWFSMPSPSTRPSRPARSDALVSASRPNAACTSTAISTHALSNPPLPPPDDHT